MLGTRQNGKLTNLLKSWNLALVKYLELEECQACSGHYIDTYYFFS